MIKVGLKSHIIKQLLILFRWTFYPILGIPWYIGFGILLGKSRKTGGVPAHGLHCISIHWPICDLWCGGLRSRISTRGGCNWSIGYWDICDPLHTQNAILRLSMVSVNTKVSYNITTIIQSEFRMDYVTDWVFWFNFIHTYSFLVWELSFPGMASTWCLISCLLPSIFSPTFTVDNNLTTTFILWASF